jgi:creatinine amidohydrolase
VHRISRKRKPPRYASKLSVHWEELTAADFREGIHRSQGTCLLPFGILEKHGPHLPLGTDLLDVRYAALHAAEQEYAVVFPEYYFGQIAEARHEPGTIAYSREMQLALLQETTDEMARNGCKKVIIVNGHGGNEHLLPYFAQTQLDKPHDYVVYVFDRRSRRLRRSAEEDFHRHARRRKRNFEDDDLPSRHGSHRPRGNRRIRRRPAPPESSRRCLHRHLVVRALSQPLFRRRLRRNARVRKIPNGLVDRYVGKTIRAVKADDVSLKLQNEFYEKSKHPLDTQP